MDRTGFHVKGGAVAGTSYRWSHWPSRSRPKPPHANPTHTEPSDGSQATALTASPRLRGVAMAWNAPVAGSKRPIPWFEDATHSVPSSQKERPDTLSRSDTSSGFPCSSQNQRNVLIAPHQPFQLGCGTAAESGSEVVKNWLENQGTLVFGSSARPVDSPVRKRPSGQLCAGCSCSQTPRVSAQAGSPLV